MAAFDKAIGTILQHEGGFCVDHAGPTNFGITLPILKAQGDWDGDGWDDGDVDRDGDVDATDIRTMPIDLARKCYQKQWWERYQYSLITSQRIATKVFDLSVNMGPVQAHKILQRGLRAVGYPVTVDGKLGPKTRAAVNNASPSLLMIALKCESAGFYRGLIVKRPDFSIYEEGWLNRAYSDPLE